MAVGIVVPPARLTRSILLSLRRRRRTWDSSQSGTTSIPSCRCTADSPFPSTGGAIPDTYRHFTDPYIALAMASGVTSKIKLGTGITLVPERNPLILAKEVAALDHYSGGEIPVRDRRRLEQGRDDDDGGRFRPPVDSDPRGHHGAEGAVD